MLTESIAILKEKEPDSRTLAITQFDVAKLRMDLDAEDKAESEKHMDDLEDVWQTLAEMMTEAIPVQKNALRKSLIEIVKTCEKNEDLVMAETWRLRLENL